MNTLRLALLAALALAACGCERVMRDMYDQPKAKPGSASPLFPNDKASRAPPPGSVIHAKGALAATSSGRVGTAAVMEDDQGAARDRLPEKPGRELLLRGRERYTIYCMPCHSPLGDGQGMVVQRGFPAPPSYHSERLRNAPDRHFYDVITNGYGVMYPYADRVAPQDRWAIVAYIRALQLSQHARFAELPAELRERLAATLPAPEQKR